MIFEHGDKLAWLWVYSDKDVAIFPGEYLIKDRWIAEKNSSPLKFIDYNTGPKLWDPEGEAVIIPREYTSRLILKVNSDGTDYRGCQAAIKVFSDPRREKSMEEVSAEIKRREWIFFHDFKNACAFNPRQWKKEAGLLDSLGDFEAQNCRILEKAIKTL